MKKIKILIAFFIGTLMCTSCGDFGEINVDPNNPSQPNTSFLFAYACKYVPNFALNDTYNPWTQMYPQYYSERQNVQYGGFSVREFSTRGYYVEMIKNLNGIIALNEDETTKNATYVVAFGTTENQIAASRTLRALAFMHLTDALGMIPYSEALKGDEGNFQPKLDTQESIYTDLDRDLSEAYAQFNENGSLSETYDILYNGDIANWKKLNASIRMLMAIKLSDVAPEVGKSRFAKAYADGGIVDNDARLEYKYLTESANENLLYNNIVTQGRADFCPSKTIIDQLNAFNDPRLPIYANPNSTGQYKGVPFGIKQDEITAYKDCSTFNARFYKQNTPLVVISATRVLLVEAEAAVRGWINADEKDLYKAAIEASFSSYDINLSEVTTYIAQTGVALQGTSDEQIKIIAMQRWLAGYMQDGVEAWSDWRRLNVPELHVGSAAGTLTHVPYRLCYSTNDINSNKENFEAAIAIQGADDFSTRVWWDIADNE